MREIEEHWIGQDGETGEIPVKREAYGVVRDAVAEMDKD